MSKNNLGFGPGQFVDGETYTNDIGTFVYSNGCFLVPKPVKKALPFFVRLDASMTKIPDNGKSHF